MGRNPLSIGEGRRLRQGRFGLFDDFREVRRVVHRHIGQDLAIEFDTRLFKPVHECGVVHIVQTARCVDTDDPEFSEFSLFLFSVAVSVNQASFDLLFGFSEVFSSSAVEAFGELHHLFVSASSYDSCFDSWHICIPFFTCFIIFDVKVPDLL
jgi:hypothetical protein